MSEDWKDIKGYEGRYQVSECGRVRRLHYYLVANQTTFCVRPGVQKQNTSIKGYSFIKIGKLYKNVHQLVAAAFLGRRRKGYVVVHLDGDKKNNNATNLKYVTKARAWKLAKKRQEINEL